MAHGVCCVFSAANEAGVSTQPSRGGVSTFNMNETRPQRQHDNRRTPHDDVFNDVTSRPQGGSRSSAERAMWFEAPQFRRQAANLDDYRLRNDRRFVQYVPPAYSGVGQTTSGLRPLDRFTSYELHQQSFSGQTVDL